MTYIPQYITLDGRFVVTPPAGHTSWQVVTPGTGYVTADIGKTVTLVGGTAVTPATARITAVSGGGITGFAEFTAQGYYTSLSTFDPLGISGGSGSGCTVQVSASNLTFVTDNMGLGSSLSHCTLAVFCNGYVFNPAVQMQGYQGGVALTLNAAQQEGIEEPVLALTLRDAAAAVIFDATFTPPTVSIFTPTPGTSFYNVLLSFDTSTHTLTLYVNDIAWPMVADSAGWTAGNFNPVANAYGSLPNGTLVGQAAIAQLYARAVYTDFTQTANRRVFLNADNTPVDPATLPAAPVNLYFVPGADQTGFATNHGTGGAWSMPGVVPSWAFFDLEYHGPVRAVTPVNTTLTLDLGTMGIGTVRPGAVMTFTINGAALHGVSTIINNVLTYTPTTGFTGTDFIGLSRVITMPAGYVSPLTWGSGFGWGTVAIIAVGLAVATETSRTTIELETLPYLVDEPAFDFQLPLGFMDRAVVGLSVFDNYDPDDNYINSTATFAELAPRSKTQTNYGSTTDLADGSTVLFGVWGDRIVASDTRNPAAANDFGYFYAPYATGVTAAPIVWTPVLANDIGFSSDWYINTPLPVVWHGLTNPVALAFDYDPTTHRHDAYVVSHEGVQKITGFMTLPYHANDPILIIPDVVNSRNWVLKYASDTSWTIYCVSALDGSTISAQNFSFGGIDVDAVLSDGIVGTGRLSTHTVLATPEGFVFYGPINRFQQSSYQNVSHRKGSFFITLKPDCSSYTLQFLVPKLDDANACTILNKNQPYMYLSTDVEGAPYMMSYYGTVGSVLSLTPPPDTDPPPTDPVHIAYSAIFYVPSGKTR